MNGVLSIGGGYGLWGFEYNDRGGFGRVVNGV